MKPDKSLEQEVQLLMGISIILASFAILLSFMLYFKKFVVEGGQMTILGVVLLVMAFQAYMSLISKKK